MKATLSARENIEVKNVGKSKDCLGDRTWKASTMRQSTGCEK